MLLRIGKWIIQILLLILWAILLFYQRIATLDIFYTNAWYLYVYIILFGIAQFIILKILKLTMAHISLFWICFIGYIAAACGNWLFLSVLNGIGIGLPFVCLFFDVCGIYLSFYFLNGRPFKKGIVILLIAFLLFCFLVYCILAPIIRKKTQPIPPDIETANRVYVEYRDEINLIADYLINAEYEYILIADHIEDGFMYADYEDVAITDERVVSAIDELLEQRVFDSFTKKGRSVTMLMIFIYDVANDSHIEYNIGRTIDGLGKPWRECVTELIPMDDEGWYFIICDHEAYSELPYEERKKKEEENFPNGR